MIIAPIDTTDCYYSAVEAHNLAEKYQLPVTIISDLLLQSIPRRSRLMHFATMCLSKEVK